MYFLKAALSGMRRRLVTSLLVILGGTALLTAMASIGMWSYWVGWEKRNLKASRTAAVFVDGADQNAAEMVLTQVLQVPGVESARVVTPQEFSDFLKQHFPDLAAAVQDLGEDIVPRTLEVVLSPTRKEGGVDREDLMTRIGGIKNVVRVDDGALSLGKALTSLSWLSYGAICLAAGLWFVLLLVCLGHYQNIFYTDAQEILLIRSLGATKFAIFLPCLFEAILQSLAASLLCLGVLTIGHTYLTDVYNQFFGALGYEPFAMNVISVFAVAGIVFLGAFVAHVVGGLFALIRGNIA